MGIKLVSFLPQKTLPETQEQFRQVSLATTGGSKTPLLPKGQLVFAYHDSFGAYGKFRYVFAKVRQVAFKPVYWSAAGKIAGVKGTTTSPLRAGVTTALISNSSYGFIQTEGANFYRVATDKGVVAGDMCIKDEATSDLYLDTATTTGTQMGWVLGRALADDSGSWMAKGKLALCCE
jgi:hypothetical protein